MPINYSKPRTSFIAEWCERMCGVPVCHPELGERHETGFPLPSLSDTPFFHVGKVSLGEAATDPGVGPPWHHETSPVSERSECREGFNRVIFLYQH